MADSTQKARERRTAARDRRRSQVSKPFEELDQAAEETVDESASPRDGELKGAAAKVVGTALAAALLGALGGAAKAVLERRSEDQDAAEADPDGDGGAAPGPSAESRAPGHEEGDENEASEERQAEAQEDVEAPVQAAAEPDRDEAHQRPGPVEGGVSGEAATEIAARARRQLESLLGTEAERVSGLERVDGGWSITLEVVEVARIPESTDVLATYELVLDDDRNLVSVNRGRRYRRSQVDGSS